MTCFFYKIGWNISIWEISPCLFKKKIYWRNIIQLSIILLRIVRFLFFSQSTVPSWWIQEFKKLKKKELRRNEKMEKVIYLYILSFFAGKSKLNRNKIQDTKKKEKLHYIFVYHLKSNTNHGWDLDKSIS